MLQARNQIYTIAAAHELFHCADAPATVRLQDYLARSGVLWEQSYGVNEIDLVTRDVDSLQVSMDLAVPVGLVVHELVANASEHAYPSDDYKYVQIEVSHVEDLVRIAVADRGVGLPAGLTVDQPKTTGLQIVSALVQQIDGELDVCTSDNGTEFQLWVACGAGNHLENGCRWNPVPA
jgi:two-component sensor histidine kinase